MALEPNTVSDLKATPGIGHIGLSWTETDPHVGGLLNLAIDQTEVWASQTNDRATATKVAEGRTTTMHPALTEGQTWYYWIRTRARGRDRNGSAVYSDWYPSGATSGVRVSTAWNSPITLINGTIVASVAANALTVAIKLLDRVTNPSASHPVKLTFFELDGSTTEVSITGSTSITIPAAEDMNVPSNNEPFNMWAAGVKVGGTFHLGIFQATWSVGGAYFLMPLSDRLYREGATAQLYSAAIPLGGPYPCRILAQMVWEDGLPSIGQWSVGPNSTILHGQGKPGPGDILQVSTTRSAVYQAIGVIPTPLPVDDTIPTTSERFWGSSVEIIPDSPASIVGVRCKVHVAPDAANQYVALMVSKGSTGATEAMTIKRSEGANIIIPLEVAHNFRAAVDELDVYFWLGYSTGGTLYINGSSGARFFGGALVTEFVVTEYMA